MSRPTCTSSQTSELTHKTALGYRAFRCSDCKRRFNERTGTPFNHLQFPTDIVLLAVLGRLRYKLSLRDVAEMFLVRGFEFTHEAVRDWEARFAPLLTALAASRGQRGSAAPTMNSGTISGCVTSRKKPGPWRNSVGYSGGDLVRCRIC
jgi:hypothetical protein